MSASSVNVEVDAKPQADMAAVLTDIRSQYETIADKNRRDMESWYQTKVRHAPGLPVRLTLHRNVRSKVSALLASSSTT